MGTNVALQLQMRTRHKRDTHFRARTRFRLTSLQPVKASVGAGVFFSETTVYPQHSSIPASDQMNWRAGALAVHFPVFPAATTCAEVFDWFDSHRDQVAAAVVGDDGEVLGIVNRLRFLARYARRYIPELYGKHSIMKLANAKPLIVDENVTIAQLSSKLVLETPDALRECFVVTREGRYFGIGTSEALVRCKVNMLVQQEEQLKAALLSATDASKTKSNFLALMSHELRTPLNAIIGFSEVLTNELFGPLGVPRYREYANDIHGAGHHLLALINDILDLSKAEAGKLDLYPEYLDIEETFESCVRLVSTRAREKKIKLDVRTGGELPALHADPLRLKQILLNLLSNAVKFTPSGGNIEMNAALGPEETFVVSVTDTGIGMAPEMIPIALEPFRQIASPLARNIEGTGLGLSLVKSLTERHGGTVAIESALNEGTCVRLIFPAENTLRAALMPHTSTSVANAAFS